MIIYYWIASAAAKRDKFIKNAHTTQMGGDLLWKKGVYRLLLL